VERCHLYLPLVDSSGVTYPYAEVTLLSLDTGVPIAEPVYLEPYGGAPQQWPILITPGVINLWTDTPLRVTVQALLPGSATFTRSGVDIGPAPASTVRSEQPVRIGSAEGLDGSAMLAVSPDGSATWQVLDVLRFHKHEGNAPGSTMLGQTSLRDIYPRQTWVGRDPNGAQGEGSSVLGPDASPDGPEAVVLGDATAGARAVVAGAGATGSASTVVLGSGGNAQQLEQVVLGRNASAAAARQGAVVVGSGVTAPTDSTVALPPGVQISEDGSVVLGQGTPPDLSWLTSDPYVAVLGTTVVPNFLTPRRDAVLAGPSSKFGAFGAAGTTRPLVSTSGLAANAPGRTALLSLVSALDKLGLIYLLDGAIDDRLDDWTKVFAHDANTGLDVGDTDGSKAGDLSRAKRNDIGPGTITYRQAAGIRDFTLHAFTWWQDWNPDNHDNEITAHVSADNVTWTPLLLAWEPLAPTTADWNQTWARNARPIPPGMQYLRITLDLNSQAWTPQIGRVVVRPVPSDG
jgi:hypothetical protein